ncbi:MAG: purine-nucleoside phosphorylase [Clostridia bacterium]|nr:purine-nucleoside phosphorylase [Clostridia bacterium]
MYNECLCCAESIRKTTGDFKPEIAVVLGSGLGGFADSVDAEFSVKYADIPGFPTTTVAGHGGRFVFGYLAGKPIAVALGRVHCYEGYTAAQAVMPVRVLKLLGVKTVILTNAAGGINTDFKPGELMLITDHISLFCESPLIGENAEQFGERFPDMSEVYGGGLKDAALKAAEKLGINLHRGVYAQVKGPQYETPAEVRMLSRLGADAVGMSTAIEAIAARHAGMNVCGISLITNMAAGIKKEPLSHREVLESSAAGEKDFCALLSAIIEAV